MSDPIVLFEIRDKIAWITLNRPTALNALIPAIVRASISFGRSRKTSRSVMIVVTGTAERLAPALIEIHS
jgi:enoyl-CoA hydratase/carnithine racemase